MRAIIDPRLGSNYPVDEYKQVIEIAIQCTTYDRNDRPKMQVEHPYIHVYTFKHVFQYTKYILKYTKYIGAHIEHIDIRTQTHTYCMHTDTHIYTYILT